MKRKITLPKYCCLLMVLLLIGCTSKSLDLSKYNDTNIRKLRAAYGLYLVTHDFRGPKDEQVFKDYLKTNPGAARSLLRQGVARDNVDSMFVSERDGQPFTVRYGINGIGDNPLIFEAVGVDGKRMVAYVEPVEMEAVEYEKALSGKTKADAPMVEMNKTSQKK